MRCLLVIAILVALANAQCANFTHIYTFDEFEINTFLAFRQHVPTTITFRRGWDGMNAQLRLTTFAPSVEAAEDYLFQVVGGDIAVNPKAALSLEVVPPIEEAETSDASSMSSFLGVSMKAAATLAVLSGGFLQTSLADSMTRQSCRVTAQVEVIMAPYQYEELQDAIQAGLIVSADSYKFENNTGDLDVSLCLDSNVQATFFQSCDKILASAKLGMSSDQELQLSEAFFLYDPQEFPHQSCSFDKLKASIRDSTALITFSCEWLGRSGTTFCGGVTEETFDFKNFANIYATEGENSTTFVIKTKAINNLQANLEAQGSVWSDFVQLWNLETVCVFWEVDEVNCAAPGKGCPVDTVPCCSASRGGCISLDDTEDGTCDGQDWTDPFNYRGPTVAKRDEVETEEAERATTLSGPACAKNHPLIGKPGVCIHKDTCKAKGGTTKAGLCPAYGNAILCCAGKGFSYKYDSAPGLCGSYAGAQTFKIKGNGDKTYTVTKILKAHLSDPSAYNAAPTAKDNTMTTSTACAFSKLRAAALKAGANIKINSGFRTLQRQQYFWHCYQCKCCNGGNLAARPGTSNHGRGIALDLNTASSGVYNWLSKNGKKFGFVRTVPSEKWHWEYRP